MRLLAIIPSGFCYGLQNVTLAFFQHFTEAIEPHFLITRWSDGEFAAKLDALRIPYTYSWLGMFSRKLDARNLAMSAECFYRLPFLYRDFFRLCRRFKPDLLYFANHHELLLLRPVVKQIGAPVVCHMHDPAPAIRFQRLNFRLYSGAVDHFVTISANVADRLRLLGTVAPDMISVVHNGVDLPFNSGDDDGHKVECRRRFGWPVDAVVVGMTGQLTPTKGCLDLLSAAKLLRESFPAIRIMINGRDNGAHAEEVKRFIVENDLRGIVAFSSWRDNVDDFYREIDILVLPSRHQEGYGLVVAEAMARRLPVVATKSGGVVEVVKDGETGFLVDREAPQELANRLDHLIRNPDLRHQMGAAGRRQVEQEFGIERQSRKLQNILIAAAERRVAER